MNISYKAIKPVDVPRLFKDVRKEEEFVELATMLAEDDHSVDKIQRDEDKYFHNSCSGKGVIARKLTMVVGLSKGFVVDKRL